MTLDMSTCSNVCLFFFFLNFFQTQNGKGLECVCDFKDSVLVSICLFF